MHAITVYKIIKINKVCDQHKHFYWFWTYIFKKEEIIPNEVRIGGSLPSDSTLSHILKIFWQHDLCDCFCIEKRSLKASVMPEDLNIWTPLKPVKFLRSFVLASFITDIKLSQTTSQEQTSNTSMVTKQTLKSLHI